MCGRDGYVDCRGEARGSVVGVQGGRWRGGVWEGAEPLTSLGSGGVMNSTFKSLQFGALLRAEDSYWGSGQSARVGAKYSENRRYGEVCWFHHWLTAGPLSACKL